MPFRAIRRQLRLIRYYSATRPSNRWSRALDIALAAALALAVPTTWALDAALVRQVSLHISAGKLFQDPGGRPWAWVGDRAMPPPEIQGESTFSGAFRLEVRTEDRGWPFVTSRRPRATRLTVDLFTGRGALENPDLPADAPERAAIATALADADLADAAAAVRQAPGALEASMRPPAWAANALVWALLLPIAAWVIVSAARFAWIPVESARRGRRQQWRREDRCSNCGYDLRASRFSARCPECGTLVH
jgi:hypothetical protein